MIRHRRRRDRREWHTVRELLRGNDEYVRLTTLRDQLIDRLMRRCMYGGRKARSANRRLWRMGFVPPERPFILYRCNPEVPHDDP